MLLNHKISRFLELLFLPIGYLISLPILIIVRLLRHWIVIRWACLISTRIGHFAANTELYCCERDQGINIPSISHIDLFWLYPKSCNKQLKKMWKNHLTILPRILMHPINRWNEKFNYFWPSNGIHDIGCGKYVDGHEIFYPPHFDRDIHNLLDISPPHLNFNNSDKARSVTQLKRMGISEYDKYVCLIVRDSGYLNKEYPATSHWEKHNYRDVNVCDFKDAADELAKNGLYVLRMGKHTLREFKTNNNNVIDYSNSKYQSDLLDIYLGANCEFCISTSAGYEAVPVIFRRPILYIGYTPVGNLWTSCEKNISTIRHHYSTKEKRILSIEEILNSKLSLSFDTNDYLVEGVELIPNTPAEIKDSCKGMINRLNGIRYTDKENKLHNIFWEKYKISLNKNPSIKKLHGKLKAHFCVNFLKTYESWLTT